LRLNQVNFSENTLQMTELFQSVWQWTMRWCYW